MVTRNEIRLGISNAYATAFLLWVKGIFKETKNIVTNGKAMHLAEERVQLPKHISEKLQPPLELLKKYGKDLGWPQWDIGFGQSDFAKMEKPCKEHGIMKIVKIGKAEVELLRLRELIDLYVEYLKNDPDIFHHA
ncbi:MAG: Aminoglycoside 3-N-acetyltransferase [Candidatus Bathyarchaeota archaeon BA1]|nr:MAG: Aminoglycoside 3-N-acetyltransferase [Candidatus Bathyarchaeota archaeon BA1]